MEQLVGDPELYIDHPPKVDYYDVFYFETRVREMMTEYLDPLRKAHLEDKERAAKLRLDYNFIIERVHELESYALIQEWKLKPSRQFYALFEGGPDGEHTLKPGRGKDARPKLEPIPPVRLARFAAARAKDQNSYPLDPIEEKR